MEAAAGRNCVERRRPRRVPDQRHMKDKPEKASEGGRWTRKPRRFGSRCRAKALHGSVTVDAKNLKWDDSMPTAARPTSVGSGCGARKTPPAERCRINPAISSCRQSQINCGRWESRLVVGRAHCDLAGENLKLHRRQLLSWTDSNLSVCIRKMRGRCHCSKKRDNSW